MTIPSTHIEIEQIYLAAEFNNCRSVCITACQSGDGVTSIATALTERYLLAGYKTLLVDLNMFHPAFYALKLNQSDAMEHWIKHKHSHRLFNGLATPNDPLAELAYKDPFMMSRRIEQWLNNFERIVIDTSPLLKINHRNIPAQSVASACDKTILVVRGNINTTTQIESAMKLLRLRKISLLGTVFNAKDQPSLSHEIIRGLKKIPFISKNLRHKLEVRLLKSQFLSQLA
ncbi:chromosome partitioning ATPase [Candidatus Photodesmus blepharus]|uniref:Chromosome partitioning ATPase n=1 Tax=Candidatus Photodesmus blepharonis TaxID=1179155 RepID=A0A084CPM1_9GAMM|nr:AAA family ATPase [Candidatus Photodesmus blepharus]KEY91750.1 chromosome partitioning ATPase [Candidatus Photodesmus blepharus]